MTEYSPFDGFDRWTPALVEDFAQCDDCGEEFDLNDLTTNGNLIVCEECDEARDARSTHLPF